MKKYLSIFLGVVGVGLVAYSLTQGWESWVQSNQFGLGFAIDPEAGYTFWQGIAAGVLSLLAFVLLFIKPKISIILGLVASGLAFWLYKFPPLDDIGNPFEPQKAIFIAIAGGVALALAGLIAPKKK